LTVLNYMVTSNHVHLLVVDDGARDVIPLSMQLVAGRIGQDRGAPCVSIGASCRPHVAPIGGAHLWSNPAA
jgi:hypothetical protein